MANKLYFIPNFLTLSRMGLAPVFAFGPQQWHLWIFIYAVVSEFLDGFLARALRAESAFGKLMDPIADKVFILTVIVTYIAYEKMYMYQFMMIGFRDLTVIGGALVVLASGNREHFANMDPGWFGKVVTAGQFGFLGYVIYSGVVPLLWLWILFGASCVAAALYVRQFFSFGLHLEVTYASEEERSRKRQAEMLTLVAISMFLGLWIVYLLSLVAQGVPSLK